MGQIANKYAQNMIKRLIKKIKDRKNDKNGRNDRTAAKGNKNGL